MADLVVISPHYDDAALSVGQLIAGHHNALIATVCTEGPQEPSEPTAYDINCGFDSDREAILSRQREDDVAARVLGADTSSLGLRDDQYGGSTQEEHDQCLYEFIERYKQAHHILAPLATLHPDHQKVMAAAMRASRALGTQLWLYEELPHRVLWPEAVEEAKAQFQEDWGAPLLHRFIGDGPMHLKEAAVRCYESQLWALDLRSVFVPERIHMVGNHE